MNKDHDLEWQRVSTAEQRAWNRYFDAQSGANKVFQFEEDDRRNIIDRANDAYEDWLRARADVDTFISDWRKSQ